MRYMLEDPANLIPDQRRDEIAAILARGVLRLRRCSTPPGQEKKAPDSGRNCLEAGATSSPDARAG